MTASLKSIVARYWFAVSTYKIPLFTTVPTNIKKPNREVMLIGQSTNHKNRKEPIRANGIVVIDMDTPGNLRKVIDGEQIGTVVRN